MGVKNFRLAPLFKVLGVYLGGSALVGVVVVSSLYLVLSGIASWRLDSAEQHWADAGIPIKDYNRSLPQHPTNPLAERLHLLAKRLGLSLMRSEAKRTDETGIGKALQTNIKTYIKEQLESPSHRATPPDADLTLRLRELEPSLAEIRALLREGPISWKMEPHLGTAAEIPNLLDHIDLSRLFIAHALLSSAENQNEIASEDLDAAWALTCGLDEQPDLITRLIVLAMRTQQLVMLRKLPSPPQEWDSRIRSYNPEEQFLDSFHHEAANWSDCANSPDSLNAIVVRAPRKNLFLFLLRPYLRFTLSRMLDYELEMVKKCRALDPCSTEEEILSAGRVPSDDIPRWDIISKIALPDLGAAWGRTHNCRIQMTLTRRVLALKEERRKTGELPEQLPAMEEPACFWRLWRYRRTPNDEIFLEFLAPQPTEAMMKITVMRPPHLYDERSDPLSPTKEGGDGSRTDLPGEEAGG